jgi:RTX calcium-binding nonapeptide repeat (4 copies)
MHNVERLENRQLFAALPSFSFTSKGTLIIQGSDGDDTITVNLAHGRPSGGFYALVTPSPKTANPALHIFQEIRADFSKTKRIMIDGGDGNDKIDINGVGSNLITQPVTILGGNGDDTIGGSTGGPILADGEAGNDTISFNTTYLYVGGTRNRDSLNAAFSTNWNLPANTILGGDGDDTLMGSLDDHIDGGNGNDTATTWVIFGSGQNKSSQRADALVHDYYARLGATGIETNTGVMI